MASKITVSKSSKNILATLSKKLDVQGPKVKQALFQVGTLVRNEAVRTITSKKIVDEGFLRANMSFKVEQSQGVARVVVGAFGVKYARLVEYGGAFTDRQRRAMFASLREQGKLERNYKSKGVIVGNQYKARPFLTPASRKTLPQVKGILLSVVRGK